MSRTVTHGGDEIAIPPEWRKYSAYFSEEDLQPYRRSRPDHVSLTVREWAVRRTRIVRWLLRDAEVVAKAHAAEAALEAAEKEAAKEPAYQAWQASNAAGNFDAELAAAWFATPAAARLKVAQDLAADATAAASAGSELLQPDIELEPSERAELERRCPGYWSGPPRPWLLEEQRKYGAILVNDEKARRPGIKTTSYVD